jgi:hypothetical protein
MNREQELETELAQLNAELVSRAQPRLAEMIDALHNMSALARSGAPGATQVLRDFTQALDEARALGSGIQVAKTLNGGAPHAV